MNNLAVLLRNLAVLLRNVGKYAEAEPLLVKVAEVRRRILGGAHPDLHITFEALVQLYECWGKAEQAAEWRAQLPRR